MNTAISRYLGLILFSVCCLSLATPLAIAKQPNVLFIFVDDQGYCHELFNVNREDLR